LRDLLIEISKTLFNDNLNAQVKVALFAVVMMNYNELCDKYPNHAVTSVVTSILKQELDDESNTYGGVELKMASMV
jgi:hypothetical protein